MIPEMTGARQRVRQARATNAHGSDSRTGLSFITVRAYDGSYRHYGGYRSYES